MEQKIREAVEQALQQQDQKQETQTLTEQVEKLEERILDLNKLSFLSVVNFGLILILFYFLFHLLDLIGNHKEAIEKLQRSAVKIKRKKDDKSPKD